MAEFHKESLTLEETNRVRISLGLKPLSGDDGDEPKREVEPVHTDAHAGGDADATRERIAKAQNRRELARKLHGTTLGQCTDTDTMSTRDWVRHARRQALSHAEQLKRQQAEEAAQSANIVHTSDDIRGMRVAHDLDEFAIESDERILTLRDAGVLDTNEDELVELSAATQPKPDPKLRSGYTGLDDDEFATDAEHRGRGILHKYDDVESLDPSQHPKPLSSGFRLGDASSLDAMHARNKARDDAQRKADEREAQVTSLDYEKNVPVSDYEVSFKKKKKTKKKHGVRVKVESDEQESFSPAPELSAAERRSRSAADTLIDDDELAASLARTRRQRAKASFKKVRPELIVHTVAAQRDADFAHPDTISKDDILFDETSEFVRQIIERPKEEPEEARVPVSSAPATAELAEPEHVEEVEMKDAPIRSEVAAAEAVAEAPTEAEAITEPLAESASMADTEAMASGSVASVLNFLRSQGTIEHTTAEQREHEKAQLKYDAWLREQRRADHERVYDPRNEREEAQAAMDKFKNYRPDVKIEYHDEYGRTLSTKEAWKQLSHTFHGNAPGYKAQEKRLRRIAEEQRRERMLAGDTSALTRAFMERSERTGQAHMVLSTGKHDHAPQDVHLGAPPALERPPPKQRKEPRGDREPKETPLALAPNAPSPNTATPDISSSNTPAPPLEFKPAFKPAMKPAFQPIGSTTPPSSTTAPSVAPAPAEQRQKVRISLGKRKLES